MRSTRLTLAVLVTAALALALLVGPAVADDSSPLYRDASQPVDARVADLIDRMTLEEKVAQLVCLWRDKNLFLDDDGQFVA
ncbi:MAG: hypothetical protein AAGE94_10850 [Acidobacteriota bacterium]